MWMASTNIADNYLKCVERCLIDENAFNKFKITDEYNSVVGMSLPWQSTLFYNKIKTFHSIHEKMNEFLRNDLYGSPPTITIDELTISPNTLRHIHTLCDITKHFGNLNGKIISELGVGYGGTAFVIETYYKPLAYHLIDLPPVQKLTLKYLKRLGITVTDALPPESVDLFISEWCLSEFDDTELYKFYEQYVKNAKNVYLAMNLHDEERKKKFIHHMNNDFDMEILPEYPVTHWPNYIIIGKQP